MLFIVHLLGACQSYSDVSSTAGLEMSGYRLSDYKGFEKKWHLVTVRYRKDTGELRWVYANPRAFKALMNHATDYPDGAVFAKIALATHDDPEFKASVVPGGVRRYQLMVRNKIRHPDTGGWGYALFDANGRTLPENLTTQVQACVACHSLVPKRGLIFSQPVSLVPMNPSQVALLARDFGVRLEFTSVDVAQLPDLVRAQCEGIKTVRVLKGDLQDHLFQGTLDEIRPTLALEVKKSGLPSLLMSRDGVRFSGVFLDPKGKSCEKNGGHGTEMKSVHSLVGGEQPIYRMSFCHEDSIPSVD